MRWIRENILLFLVVTAIVLLLLRQKMKWQDYVAVHATEEVTEPLDVPSDWQQYWKEVDARRADSLRQLRALEKAQQKPDSLPSEYAEKSVKTGEKTLEKPKVTSKSVVPTLEKSDRLAIVVVGSFGERSHAEAALKKLKSAGFGDAQLLMKKGSPNILVAASTHSSRAAANRTKSAVQRKGFQAYVLDASAKEIFNQ